MEEQQSGLSSSQSGHASLLWTMMKAGWFYLART
jgi:hypothetical protein